MVLDKDASFAENICTVFREQGITINLTLTALSITIFKILPVITDIFGGEEAPAASGYQQKMKNFKKWPNKLEDGLKSLLERPLKCCLLLWEVLLVPF